MNPQQAQPASASPRLDTAPALRGLAIGIIAFATSVLLGLLLASTLFGYPAGGLA